MPKNIGYGKANMKGKAKGSRKMKSSTTQKKAMKPSKKTGVY